MKPKDLEQINLFDIKIDYDKKIILENKIENYVEKSHITNITQEGIDLKVKRQNDLKKRNKLVNLINSNPQLNVFLTLTFKDNLQDFKYAYKCLKEFTRKINKVNKKFEYISVIEFQKRGAIHFHLLCNLEVDFKINKNECRKSNKQKDFELLIEDYYWTYGFVNVQPLKPNKKYGNDIDNLGSYLVKYMTKECDNYLVKNQKMFSTSKGLIQPIEIKILDRENIIYCEGEPTFKNHYESDFTGLVNFEEYNKKRQAYKKKEELA